MLQKETLQKVKPLLYLGGLFLFLLAGPLPVWAQLQDNIYLIDETSIKNIEILQIDSKRLKYRTKNGKDQAMNTKQVVMAFNGRGRYLVFPSSDEQIGTFFTDEQQPSEVDLIVTLSEQVIPGYINAEDPMHIDFQDAASQEATKKYSTTEIAAILYKDGRHKLFTSPSQASSILTAASGQISKTRLASYQKAAPKAATPPTQLLSSVTPAVQEEKEEAAPVVASVESTAPATGPAPQASLKIDHALYSRKALQKTEDLSTYLGIISSRSSELQEADKAVEMAIRLFVNEDAQVEVSSKAGRARHKIRAYLNKLKLLKYDRIEIHWTDISYVSDLKKGVDGNYYGIITLQQRFMGFHENKLVYSDLTEKNVEVIVKAYQKEVDGEKQEMWDVFLSDIGVVETKYQ